MSSCLSLEYPESRSRQDGVQAAYSADDAARPEERRRHKEENQEKGVLGGQGLGQLPLSPLGDSLRDHVEPTARKGEAGTLPSESRPGVDRTVHVARENRVRRNCPSQSPATPRTPELWAGPWRFLGTPAPSSSPCPDTSDICSG